MVVADASVIVDALIRRGSRGDWAAEAIAASVVLAAPHVVDVEVLSAIRRLASRNVISGEDGQRAVRVFANLRIRRFPVTDLLDRLWGLCAALSPYDAAYVALAEALDLRLLTTDARLARSHGHRVDVVTYSD